MSLASCLMADNTMDNTNTTSTTAESIAGEAMSPTEVVQALAAFNQRNALPVSKVEMTPLEQQKLWGKLDKLLRHSSDQKTILNTIRILSRNKDVVNKVLSRDFMDLLLTLAGFPADEGATSSRQADGKVDWDTVLEACKVTSNIYFQSTAAIGLCFANKAVQRIFRQTEAYRRHNVPKAVIEFDFKILFLITAHSEEARTLSRYTCDAFPKLIGYLEEAIEAGLASSSKKGAPVLPSEDASVVSAGLKVLVNLTHFMNTSLPSEDVQVDEETFGYFERMGKMCHTTFTVESEDVVYREMMVRDFVHLLTNFPIRAMSGLLAELNEEYVPDAKSKTVRFQDTVVNVPKSIFEHLMDTLQTKKPSIHNVRDNSTPILKVVCMLSAGYPAVRKYYRSLVLPPITDVKQRPEDGDSARAVLCRLLTSPDSTLSVMVAEFIFILCKESVRRMIKYTGYGNAAGLLARKGLMGGAKHTKEGASNYSSSESDSDTEEYASNAYKVNPITGFAEERPPNAPRPFEGMSDEQKEYEAVHLANLIDKLHSMGVVKPAKLGDDGKPHPVDHVLELCEAQAQHQMGNIQQTQQEDSD